LKLLLDTHVLLWAATDPARLSADARATLEDGTNEAWMSIVTAWEVAIKQSLGKLELPASAERWLPEVLRRTGVEVAGVSLKAATRVHGLPWHHRDPFDRLLIAHALESGYAIMTSDTAFAAYGVPLVKA
jgi:PIN domain nuclease of toxin-antitoxin system